MLIIKIKVRTLLYYSYPKVTISYIFPTKSPKLYSLQFIFIIIKLSVYY